MARGQSERFRRRKLSVKTPLPIVQESDIESGDEDTQRHIPEVETGVERQEEIEHHLVAAIKASARTASGKSEEKIVIPTPKTQELSADNYDKLYPKDYSRTFTYLRASDQVEECLKHRTEYCSSREDETYCLRWSESFAKGNGQAIDLLTFEIIMGHFEKTVQQRQPFLDLDVENIGNFLKWEEMAATLQENDSIKTQDEAALKAIYEYWLDLKRKRGGKTIMPSLKFEQATEKDEGDPYVAFRRRELRSTRRQRKNNISDIRKLKDLYQQLKNADHIVNAVYTREDTRAKFYENESKLFEARKLQVNVKRRLGIKGDDEDLYNRPKRARIEAPPQALQRAPLRISDGREPVTRTLEDYNADKESRAEKLRMHHQTRHNKEQASTGYVDTTLDVLHSSPRRPRPSAAGDFSGVSTFFISTAYPESLKPAVVNSLATSRHSHQVRFRQGRGGRYLIDRRVPSSFERICDPILADRMRFDEDSADIYSQPMELDQFDPKHIQFMGALSRQHGFQQKAGQHLQYSAITR